MKPIRIVHMTSVHSATDNRIFQKECRSLALAGFEVTSIGPHPSDAVLDQVRIKSICRYRSRLARMTRAVWHIYWEALRLNADAYHFHDPELILVGLLLRSRGREVIYDVHEDYPKDILSKPYLPPWSRKAIAWMVDQIEGIAGRHLSALVTVTPSIARRFQTVNRRTMVVHNFPQLKELAFEQSSVAWNTRKHSVAYVGAITAQRGIREMVEAMSLLPNSLAATLELAGPEMSEDVCPEKLYQHAGWSRVQHHGLLERPDTFRLLRSVRAGLALFHPEPNHLEAMPQKIFEYMGAGLPVIASDFPVWRQLLGDIGCAIFVDPMDPHAIARAIEYVMTHPQESEEMGRRGERIIRQRYNWDSEAKKLVALYRELVKHTCAA